MPIAEDGQGTKQSSPLIIAFVLGLAATGGGLLLSTVEEVGLSVAEGSATTASLGLDDRTKAMLTVSWRRGPAGLPLEAAGPGQCAHTLTSPLYRLCRLPLKGSASLPAAAPCLTAQHPFTGT